MYVGGSEGYGLRHAVIDVTGVQITTWSAEDPESGGGFTWLGVRDDFVELFKHVSPPPKHAPNVG